MNTKLLASFAVFVLLTAVVSISLTDSAFAAEDKKSIKKEMKEKKEAVKKEMKEKKEAVKKEMKEKKEAVKKEMKEKKEAVKKEMKEKKEAVKKEMKEKKEAVKKEMKEMKHEMKDAKKTATTGTAASEVTVDMAKGTASDTNCGDQCYMPSTVTVTVGGKVTWKNVDSAAHTATATDSSFDTSLVNAGASASNTFNTAGSYQYMCILHPWMKGTVNVQ